MWPKAEDFRSLVEVWQRSFEVRGAGSYVVTEKLKAIKTKLKCWNNDIFGIVEVKKKQALEAHKHLSCQELEKMIVAAEDFKKWALREEIMWRQRSREVWLKEGNKNTSFFHKTTNSHRKTMKLLK